MRSPNPKGIRRAQEDHLVDRLEVEAQQCVQLTSTNRPFGLSIELILRSKSAVRDTQQALFVVAQSQCNSLAMQVCGASLPCLVPGRNRPCVQGDGCGETTTKRRIRLAGEHTARVTPVPIPNTEVKPRRADGTARESVWEIR